MSHTELTHFFLTKHVRRGDTVIDATCGNGHDALHLANLALSPTDGTLYCIDIQEDAIASTQKRLDEHPSLSRIIFLHSSHENLPDCSPSTIVYNFGYLPGSDHSITTRETTSLQSLSKSMVILKPGGAIFATFYPGHSEGAVELNAFMKQLPSIESNNFKIFTYHQITSKTAPQLFIIKKPFTKTHTQTIQDFHLK